VLRRVSIDYGKLYFYRHELFLPFLFALAFCSMAAVFVIPIVGSKLQYFQPDSVDVKEIQFALAILAVLLYYMTFNLLLGFAKINEFFEFHVLKLYNVKQVLSDLLKYQQYYFPPEDQIASEPKSDPLEEDIVVEDVHSRGKEDQRLRAPGVKGTTQSGFQGMPGSASANANLTSGYCKGINLNDVFRTRPGSHVHVRLAREIRLTLGANLHTELMSFLFRSMESVQNIIQEVEIDQRYQSVEILGFVISKPFILNLYVVMGSIAVTLYQFLPM
jgi:hypothetical protein